MIFSAFNAAGCIDSNRRYGGMTVAEAFPDPAVRNLAKAAAVGDLKIIDKSIAMGIDVNATGTKGVTPLWWSIIVYNFTGFEHLLSKGANPNIQPFGYRNAGYQNVMDFAAMAKDSEFLEAAIKAGGDVNLVSRFDGATPIFSAIIGRELRNIELLISHGADLNFQDPTGKTPLIAAVDINDFEIAYYLLARGADPTLKVKTGQTVLFSIKNNRIDPESEGFRWRQKVMALLKEKGIDIDRGQ